MTEDELIRTHCWRCGSTKLHSRAYFPHDAMIVADLIRRGWQSEEGEFICPGCQELRRLDIAQMVRDQEL